MAARFRLGLDTYSYHFAAPFWHVTPPEPWGIDDYLDRAAELELGHVELADMRHLPDTEPATIARLRAAADQRGLSVALGTGGLDLKHLTRLLHASAALGAPVLRTFTDLGATWRPNCGQADFDAAADVLRRLGPICDQTGVSLAIENHHDVTADELAGLLEAVDHPRIGVCFDTGNALGVFEDPLVSAKRLARWTLDVHLKAYAVLPGNLLEATGDDQVNRDDGCTLVNIPIGMAADALRDLLRMLMSESMADTLTVNVESSVELIPIGPGRDGWHDALAPRLTELRAIAPMAPTADPAALRAWLANRSMSVDALLALEDKLVRRSVADAHALMADLRNARP